MKTENIHPQIKESLKTDVNRKAPERLRVSIMQQVMRIHQARFHVPSYNGLAIFGLIACAMLIAIPMYLPEQTVTQPSLNWNLPELSIPSWLWFSICAGLSLFAADSLINQRLRQQKVQTKKHE